MLWWGSPKWDKTSTMSSGGSLNTATHVGGRSAKSLLGYQKEYSLWSVCVHLGSTPCVRGVGVTERPNRLSFCNVVAICRTGKVNSGGETLGPDQSSLGFRRDSSVMANHYLPPEILDHIIDLLHDEPESLKACCIVSKSWIPRTRKYLFAKVEFASVKDFEKETFPDPSNSPAYHTRALFVRCA